MEFINIDCNNDINRIGINYHFIGWMQCALDALNNLDDLEQSIYNSKVDLIDELDILDCVFRDFVCRYMAYEEYEPCEYDSRLVSCIRSLTHYMSIYIFRTCKIQRHAISNKYTIDKKLRNIVLTLRQIIKQYLIDHYMHE